MFQADLKVGNSVPGEREINYGAFVSALIKVANMRHLLLESKTQVTSKRVYNDY